MEDLAIHLVAAIARDGRATQHRVPRDSGPPGEKAHQLRTLTNPPELLHQQCHRKFCRRKVHYMVPVEIMRSMELARIGFYRHDLLRLHKPSLQNPRLYLNAHPHL
ncbi:uncharacterized protein N7511_000976 [Penicillium nucicola]|uniref:uncharacterized protein n=1 Tax=Penicillium nucicola TaxID=1850975 RepID=UPI00254523E8|nr:uncharacterized protein N7511_000976 [Penicillium nucicola]KAJ5775965.1 hypothetical protein N7511_000976 [Penicillium nucicola]